MRLALASESDKQSEVKKPEKSTGADGRPFVHWPLQNGVSNCQWWSQTNGLRQHIKNNAGNDSYWIKVVQLRILSKKSDDQVERSEHRQTVDSGSA